MSLSFIATFCFATLYSQFRLKNNMLLQFLSHLKIFRRDQKQFRFFVLVFAHVLQLLQTSKQLYDYFFFAITTITINVYFNIQNMTKTSLNKFFQLEHLVFLKSTVNLTTLQFKKVDQFEVANLTPPCRSESNLTILFD